jgi:hypothetical protein
MEEEWRGGAWIWGLVDSNLKKSRFLDWTLPSWDFVGRYCHKLRERNYERSWTQSFFVMVLLHLIDTHWKREKRNPVESNFRNWWSFVKQKGNNVNLLQYQVVEGLGQLLGMCVWERERERERERGDLVNKKWKHHDPIGHLWSNFNFPDFKK